MREADLAAAARRIDGRDEPQIVAGATLLDQAGRTGAHCRCDFSRSSGIGAVRAMSTPTSSAARLSSGGVPTMAPAMPGAGR